MGNAPLLVINSGSSTVKYGLYDPHSLACLKREVIKIHEGEYQATLEKIIEQCSEVSAVGHRIVHGGQHYAKPVLISDEVLSQLDSLSALAPMHQPFNLKAVTLIREKWPDMPQIACFDTAFHRDQPKLNQLYAIPRALTEKGMIRYGFHGLSYEYIAEQLPKHSDKASGKVIVLHLGSGASACAMEGLRSISSSMGFTALDGLMMATRCGTIDPGLVLHLLTQESMNAEQVTELLYKKSGLLGVSGLSADMRELVASSNANAQEATALFCHYITRVVGQLIAELQGLDMLVFTAGIGENQPAIREKIIQSLNWMGVEIDNTANQQNAVRITTDKSKIECLVIPTNEEHIIAQHTAVISIQLTKNIKQNYRT